MVIDSIQQRQIVRFRFKYRYVERGQYRHVPCAPDDGWAYSLRAALLVARKLDNINTYEMCLSTEWLETDIVPTRSFSSPVT